MMARLTVPAGQLAFCFMAAPIPPRVGKCGWTAEAGMKRKPGHPWAHPKLYPDLRIVRLNGIARATVEAEVGKLEMPYSFPVGRTPKAAQKRAEYLARFREAAARDEAQYVKYRALARAFPEGRVSRFECDGVYREALALKYNHVMYCAWFERAVAIAYPELLMQEAA